MLTALKIKSAAPRERAYKLSDGDGLFLLVEPNGARKWRFRFRLQGKEVLMSLGSFPEIGLAEAREALFEARKLVARGRNPVEERREARAATQKAFEEQTRNRFSTVVNSWTARRSSELRRATRVQTERELKKHILPAFGEHDITAITRPQLTAFLQRVHQNAPETARNLRGHLSGIFEHAIDTGVLNNNPTPPGRILGVRTTKHHPALPSRELGTLLTKLDAATTIYERTRCAFLLILFTAGRKTEVTSARWDEIDLEKAVWNVPASRMKAKRPHWVPLSKQAVKLLQGLQHLNGTIGSAFVFPHRDRPGRPMEGASINALLQRMGYRGLATPHGMRATFSTHFNALGANADVIERCLAHGTRDQSRASYNRHEYQQERRTLLQQWADHLDELRKSK